MSHEDSAYEIPIVGATCIRGPNGAGKSHIYNAIRWAIFPKHGKNVHPLGTSGSVEVQLCLPGGIAITRTATPNTIKVKVNGKTTKGADADALLENMFGCKKTWGLCSHLESNKHPFIAALGPQKIEMVNQIVGGDDEIKAKISAKLSASKAAMTKASDTYNKKKIQYTALHGNNFASVGVGILSDEELKKCQHDAIMLKNDIQDYERDLRELTALEKREADLLDIVNGVVYTEKELKKLSDMKIAYDIYSTKLNHYLSLTKNTTAIAQMFTDDEINETLLNTKLYSDNVMLCKSLGIVYDKCTISKVIQECQQQIDVTKSITEDHQRQVKEHRIKVEQRKAVIDEYHQQIDKQHRKAAQYKQQQITHRTLQSDILKQQISMRQQQVELLQQQQLAKYKILQDTHYQKQSEYTAAIKFIKEHQDLTRQLCNANSILGTDVASANNELASLCDQLTILEKNMQYTNLFESRMKLESLLNQLKDLSLNLSDDEVQARAALLTRSIDNRWIVEDRKEYEIAYLRVFPSHKTIKSSAVSDERYYLKQQLKDIKLSKVVKSCPHCSGCLAIVNNDIVKYEGKVVTGNVNEIHSRLDVIERLHAMKYPDMPLLEIDTTNSVAVMKEELALIKKVSQLKVEAASYSSLEVLPKGVQYVSWSDGQIEHKKLKGRIVAYERVILLESKLNTLGACPPEPHQPDPIPKYTCNNIKDDEEYIKLTSAYTKLLNTPLLVKDITTTFSMPAEIPPVPQLQRLLRDVTEYDNPSKIISEASKIVFISPPLHTVQYMKLCIDIFTAETELNSIKKVAQVTDRQVLNYAACLGSYTSAVIELSTVQSNIDKIGVTDEILASSKRKLKRALLAIDVHHKSVITKKSYLELKKVKTAYTQSKECYDRVIEFKEIVELELKQIIIGFISRIENDVNIFLEALESPISLNIIYTDKIKLVCFKNGDEVGKPENLSQGEQSLMSFAITISFALQSPSSILILDEITDKLSAENKDRAIELLLETLKNTKKCLLITDHNCHCGDYDKVIELTGRPLLDEEIVDSD